MKATLIVVGRLKKGPERELVQRYEQRIASTGRSVGLTGFDTVELPESRAGQPDLRKREEATAIADRLSPESARIVFDERGKAIDSVAFASLLRNLLDNGRRPSFIIGGADGLDGSVRDGSEAVVSFGRLTLPHQIVRILAVEQIYRAITILSGHPYHKA